MNLENVTSDGFRLFDFLHYHGLRDGGTCKFLCSVGPEPKLSRTCAENYKSDSCFKDLVLLLLI